jgi:hypothetical protein
MCLSSGVLGYLVLMGPLPFVAEWWGPKGPEWYDPWYRRHRMADAFVLTGRFTGASRADIVGLLGEPPEHGYFRHYDLVYPLGAERSWLGIDSEWLAIKLDADGVATQVEIVRD